MPIEDDGKLVAPSDKARAYRRGDRVLDQKFGYGAVSLVEDAKLTVSFDKAGEKKVLDSSVERA